MATNQREANPLIASLEEQLSRESGALVKACNALTIAQERADKLRHEKAELVGEVREAMQPILERLQLLEKYELTMCNGPDDTRDDSISKFSLTITRKALEAANDLVAKVQQHPTKPGLYRFHQQGKEGS